MSLRFLILPFLLACVLSQDSNLGDLNGCAKDTLGNSLPKDEKDCFIDKSSIEKNCCFIKATMQGISVNFCYPIDKKYDSAEVEASIAIYGPDASVKCSATSISLSLMLIAILALFLF
jgi:hypothetical protein